MVELFCIPERQCCPGQLTDLGEAAWFTGLPPSRTHHLAIFMRRGDSIRLAFLPGDQCDGIVSLAADLHDHGSASRPVELTEVDPLPCPEDQTAVLDEDLLAAPHERALAVRVGVAFAVAIARV